MESSRIGVGARRLRIDLRSGQAASCELQRDGSDKVCVVFRSMHARIGNARSKIGRTQRLSDFTADLEVCQRDRRTNRSQAMAWIDTKPRECCNGSGDDTRHDAAPTSVDRSDRARLWATKKNRHAVGHTDEYRGSATRTGHRIRFGACARGFYGSDDPTAVHLAGVRHNALAREPRGNEEARVILVQRLVAVARRVLSDARVGLWRLKVQRTQRLRAHATKARREGVTKPSGFEQRTLKDDHT